MKQFNGAVFFLDILGVGNLTRGKVGLAEDDYAAWKVDPAQENAHQLFCARLLSEFRRGLERFRTPYSKAKFAQLSDCAFVWSKDAASVWLAASDLMWHLTNNGVLCRGGIAYGQIVEPEKTNARLGQFILGEAVTNAVKLERSGKGCRIFCDREFPVEILSETRNLRLQPFQPLTNPLDGIVIDEFEWYLMLGRKPQTESTFRTELARALCKLLVKMKHSSKFAWNCSSAEGLVHVACGVASVSSALERCVPGSTYHISAASFMEMPVNRGEVVERNVLSYMLNDLKGHLRT